MSSYPVLPLLASAAADGAGWPPDLPGGPVISVWGADLASSARQPLREGGQTALTAAGTGRIRSGDLVVFCKPVVIGPRLSAVAELAFVPDEVDVVEVLGDQLSRPAPAARPADQLEAGVDASDVVVQVVAGERADADVVLGEFRGRCPPDGQVQAFDEPLVVRRLFRSVSLPCSGR